MIRIGSLFAGIGGFDLAARRVGWETAWYSEIDPYACEVMKKNFPGAPNHGDVTQLEGSKVEPVDLLCGGFPCQDISLAGKGAGITGSRSGLWTHYARLIEEIRPRWVVIENVSALRSRGLDTVLGALAALGYDAEWHCIPAAAVGAPHRRDRVWIMAHAPQFAQRESANQANAVAAGGKARHESVDGRADVSYTDHEGEPDVRVNAVAGPSLSESPRRDDWWQSEPDVGRVADGVPARVDRLRCLGNAIVSQVAEVIFRAIVIEELCR